MPKQPVNTIRAPINVSPIHLVRLARFCAWTLAAAPSATPHTFTLTPARIARLAAGGILPDQLLDQLAAALGRRPSRRTIQQVRDWARPGQQLRLRPLLVLEADTPERLAHLRRHKLVRNRLGEVIAPNRIALNPSDAPALAQTLRTLGYYVEPPAPAAPEPVEGPPPLPITHSQFAINHSSSPAPSTPAPAPEPESAPEPTPAPELVEGALAPTLQWFLITLYQGLGQHLALPIDLPWAVRQALRAQLTASQQATAEAAARQLLDQLQLALNGYLQVTTWQLPATADAEPTIRTALARGKDITIRYQGAGEGQVTSRTVTPYWIEERHGIRYLIGWCHLRQQERVFRLDRIEAVAEA